MVNEPVWIQKREISLLYSTELFQLLGVSQTRQLRDNVYFATVHEAILCNSGSKDIKKWFVMLSTLSPGLNLSPIARITELE